MRAFHLRDGFRPSLSSVLFLFVMVALLIGGGASRADVLGQVIVRLVASVALVAAIMLGPRPAIDGVLPVALLLGAAILLAFLQMLPLPPSIWQSLPGRALFGDALGVAPAQPWRPLAIVPGAAFNALGSLIVPASVLVLITMAPARERQYLCGFLLVTILAGACLAFAQLSAGGMDNPLINETVKQVSGNFANRNHFALFLAIGCLIAPVWGFNGTSSSIVRGIIGLSLLTLFELLILIIGSRSGLGMGVISFLIAMFLIKDRFYLIARKLPKRVVLIILGIAIAMVATVIVAAIKVNRAIALDRLFSTDLGEDMRSRSLPVLRAMIVEYFPAGSGLGSFDSVFRIHEPLSLLKLTYFNHAHNDFLEVVLTAGLPGLLLLAAAIGWWAIASVRAWRAAPSRRITLARLGAAMLLLVLFASAFDYPARTPMVMAIIVVAGVWLGGARGERGSALPQAVPHL